MRTSVLLAGTLLAACLPGCASRREPPVPPIAAPVVTPAPASPPSTDGTRTVRYWHEEKGEDGGTILVAEDWIVDKNGRMMRKLK
jgi:hypothetical protein